MKFLVPLAQSFLTFAGLRTPSEPTAQNKSPVHSQSQQGQVGHESTPGASQKPSPRKNPGPGAGTPPLRGNPFRKDKHVAQGGAVATVSNVQTAAAETANRILQATGMDLSSIPEEVRKVIPDNVNMDSLGKFHGAYLTDLQPLRIAAHGEEARVQSSSISRQSGNDEKGFNSQALHTREDHSVVGKEVRAEGRHNKHDVSRIGGPDSGLFISAAPTPTNARAHLEAFAEHGVQISVDLRQNEYFGLTSGEIQERIEKGEKFKSEDGIDYFASKEAGMTFLSRSHEPIKVDEQVGNPSHTYRLGVFKDKSGKNHSIAQVKIRDLPDCGIPTKEGIVNIFREIGAVADKLTLNPAKVHFHCAGGLGRSPTLGALYVVWNHAKAAHAAGLKCTCDWNRQSEPTVDGKMNLAHSHRNAFIHGTYARSTFGQSEKQFLGAPEVTEYIASMFSGT
jgi:hypothetical protein